MSLYLAMKTTPIASLYKTVIIMKIDAKITKFIYRMDFYILYQFDHYICEAKVSKSFFGKTSTVEISMVK